VRDGILECHWESTSEHSKIAKIVLPQSRVKDLLNELHGGPSGGHLGVNMTLGKVSQRYYWLQARNVEKCRQACNICAVSHGPRTRNLGLMHYYNVGVLFERIAIDVGGPFLCSTQGNQYLLIAMDYFTKWLEAYIIPSQEASMVEEALVTNFCLFGVPWEEFRVLSNAGGFAMPGSEQDVHHTPAPAVGQHGGMVHQYGRGASVEGRCVALEVLGREITKSSSLPTGHPPMTVWA
jgi:hypothetical protein